jgi:hypothetical protein
MAPRYGGFMRATQRKGDIATARAVATFTEMGFDVALPLTESAAYDLVVDDGDRLRRVQCKFTGGRQVDLRRIHSNSNGYVVKRTAVAAYDWLYVLRSDGSEYLIKECLAGRRAVNLSNADRIRAGSRECLDALHSRADDGHRARATLAVPAGCQSGQMGQS